MTKADIVQVCVHGRSGIKVVEKEGVRERERLERDWREIGETGEWGVMAGEAGTRVQIEKRKGNGRRILFLSTVD